MQPITYSSEGLCQCSSQSYSRKVQRVPGPVFVRTIQLTLPLFLTLEVWLRHQYTLQDIATTLEYFSVLHLWQCASLFGITISNSAVRCSFGSYGCMTFTSKAVVLKKIIKFLSDLSFSTGSSVLEITKREHIPPLPLHALPLHDWSELYQLLPTTTHPDLLAILPYQGYWVWRQILVVPLFLEDTDIYAVRIVSKAVYDSSGRNKTHSIAHRPLLFSIQGEIYCGLEECWYFSKTIQPKKLLSI